MIETPRPVRARYLILRRNTGELVLSTEADLAHGHAEGAPRIHSDGCYVRVPGPSQPAPAHQVRDGYGFNADNSPKMRDCSCRCHTRKGLAAYKAEQLAYVKKNRDPANQKFDFEGGSSMGVNLARRVRRVAADHQRRMQALDARIAKLQRERTAIIRSTFGSGGVLTPADLAKIAATPRDKRGTTRREVESALAAKNTISPEGRAR